MRTALLPLPLLMSLSAWLPAMAPRPVLRPDAAAAARYQAADFADAEAAWRAAAGAGDESARRAWLALIFERQGYSAFQVSVRSQGERAAWESLLLARALANQGKWAEALPVLEELGPGLPQGQWLRAQALGALGSPEAEAAWKRLLMLQARPARFPGLPLACLQAGDDAAQRGQKALAEERYKRAEKLDGALEGVHMRLAQLYLESGRHADARVRLERALKSDPRDLEARDCLNLLLKEQPGLLKAIRDQEKKKEAERLRGRNPTVTPLLLRPGEPVLQVGVLAGAVSLSLRTGRPTRCDPAGLTLPAGVFLRASLKGSLWRLEKVDAAGSSELASFTESLRLVPLQEGSTLALFDIDYGKGYFFAGKEDRYYRGELELRPQGLKFLRVLNHVPVEAYLLSVLPSEVNARWPAGALKAQAVAARSDTLSKLRRHGSDGFDLCSDVHCAMYRGVEEEDKRSSLAVIATEGELLQEHGRPIGGIYHNSCGGHTQDAWDTWIGEPRADSHAAWDGEAGSPWKARFPLGPGDLLAFLDEEGEPSRAWCDASSEPYAHWRWVARYSRAELEKYVGRRHEIGLLQAVEPLERGPGGQVKRLRFSGSLGSSIGSSDYIRSAVKGLRSNFFYVETRRNARGEAVEFLFHGGGWGHGVGFCQAGASAMAAAGKTHQEILKHYFHSSSIDKKY